MQALRNHLPSLRRSSAPPLPLLSPLETKIQIQIELFMTQVATRELLLEGCCKLEEAQLVYQDNKVDVAGQAERMDKILEIFKIQLPKSLGEQQPIILEEFTKYFTAHLQDQWVNKLAQDFDQVKINEDSSDAWEKQFFTCVDFFKKKGKFALDKAMIKNLKDKVNASINFNAQKKGNFTILEDWRCMKVKIDKQILERQNSLYSSLNK